MGESVKSNGRSDEEFGRHRWHRPLERSWKAFRKHRRCSSYCSDGSEQGSNSDENASENQCYMSPPIINKERCEKEHAHKEEAHDVGCCHGSSDMSCDSQCTPLEAALNQNFKSPMTVDDFHMFNTSPRTLVRSLQQQFSPESEKVKKQAKERCADAGYDPIWSIRNNPIASDTDDELRARKQGLANVACRGRMLFSDLESVVNGDLERRKAQAGDPDKLSSPWSSTVEKVGFTSSASSNIPFPEITDKQEELPIINMQTVAVKGNPGVNCRKEEITQKDVDSVEVLSIYSEFKEASASGGGWAKAWSLMDFTLRGSLYVVLLVPAAMVAIKTFTCQEKYHILVPT
eukprot:Gb_33275 [translate_table: standard]